MGLDRPSGSWDNEPMEPTGAEKRFRGQARLVRLLLWKVGESTDVGAGLQAAVCQKMISSEDAGFLRLCMDAEERGRDGGSMGMDITADTVARLQRCADKLNRADSA